MDPYNQRLNIADPRHDVINQPLMAGDLVMYSASASGRLAVAEVVEFTKTKIRVRHVGSSRTWTGGPDRFVKVNIDA